MGDDSAYSDKNDVYDSCRSDLPPSALTFLVQLGSLSEGGQRSFAALLPFLALVLSKIALLLPFAGGSYFIDQRHRMLEIQILSVANWGLRICLRIALRRLSGA